MPLTLFHCASLAPHLPHFLDAIGKKHFQLNLKDRFRILTSDEESKKDIEGLFLEHESSRGVFIGQSVTTLSTWLFEMVRLYSLPKPLASTAIQIKALRRLLPKYFPHLPLDPAILHSCLFEMGRLLQLHEAEELAKPPPWFALFQEWERLLEHSFGAWSPQRYEAEALRLIKLKQTDHLAEVQEIYCMGYYEARGLVSRVAETLLQAYPAIDFYLYLAPAEKIARLGPAWEGTSEKLSRLAGERRFHLSSPLPQVRVQCYPTPLHEGRHLYRDFFATPGSAQILGPRHAASSKILLRLLADAEDLSDSDSPSANLGLWKLLSLFSEWSDTESLSFDKVFQKISEGLGGLRKVAQECRDAASLKLYDRFYEGMRERWIAESLSPENRSPEAWREEILQEIEMSEAVRPKSPEEEVWRDAARPGLALVERLWICGLQEGQFPSSGKAFHLAEDFQDPLLAWEQEQKFFQSLGRAQSEIILCLSEISLAGRDQAASPFLAEWEPLPPPATLATHLPMKEKSRHPYAEENQRRERERSVLLELNRDAGNLTQAAGGFSLLKKLQRRPLSAGYMDDYAKCAWRFFARFSLGLKKIPEEDLEVEPLSRGTFQHNLLENIFRQLHEGHFSKQSLPDQNELDLLLESSHLRLSEALGAEEKHPNIPSVVLQDQLERMKAQVQGLLAAEHRDWDQAKEKLIPHAMEWIFGKAGNPPWHFTLSDGSKIPFSGAIDRIDLSQDGARFLVIDYKAGNTSEMSSHLRQLRGFQLYIYLMAVQDILWPEKEPIGGLYWDLREQKKNQGFVLKDRLSPFSVKRLQGDSFMKAEPFRELQSNLKGRLEENLKRILAGDFSLKPEHCIGKYCEFWDICRYTEKST